MNHHWTELLPIDEYIIRTNGVLQEFDRKVLTLLYQPLLGATCYSLYMTLWSEVEVNRLWGKQNKHHHLMSMMQLNLKQIFEDRKKLEGIGLLKTFLKEDDTSRTYIYELQAPLSPQAFFNDGVLNIYLYNRLGKTSFNKVKQFFSDYKIETNNYLEVTSAFNDVFTSLSPSELTTTNLEMKNALTIEEQAEFSQRGNPSGIFVTEDHFDFSLFFAGISESLIPKEAFTPKVKEIIAKLSFLYRIDPVEMKKVVVQALDERDEINIEELRKSARDYYQFMNGDALPTLVKNTQPLSFRSNQAAEPSNKEEQLISYLERVSPYQLLVDISGGVEPAAADLQIIENVMINQKLPPGVVNVLIHYVMLKTDMKLSKNYVERIAGHWARKEIKMVREAMDLAKQEHRQYQQWASNKEKKAKQEGERHQKFSKDKMNPDVKRRLLMLGVDEYETEKKQVKPDVSEDDRKKRKQKMFDLLNGKGE
ncbi:replication initiation and membrane attachment family protein [Schinkia sp. CFF1]